MNEDVAIQRDRTGQSRVGPTPLIELRDVTKRFHRGEVAIDVLKGVTLSIFPGEYVAIMGASGSGKTTLMNILGCLDAPSSGSYRLLGQEVAASDPDTQALLRRETFGFIFQQYNLLGNATAAENVEMPAIYSGRPYAERAARARGLLQMLGLGDRCNHKPSQLSGGQQQRVSIARALMNGGRVLLADEPTGALDRKTGIEMLEHLEGLNAQGHTLILVTHDQAIARRAHRIIELRDGVVHADTDTGAMMKRAAGEVAVPASVTPSSRLPSAGEFRAAVAMALRSLRTNIFRTTLTLLGISIGVAAVISLIAITNGTKDEILQNISAMGSNLLLIRPGAPNIRNGGVPTVSLIREDADAIAALENVVWAVPEAPVQVTVRYGKTDYVTSADSTTPGLTAVRDWSVESGSFFSDLDVKRIAPVAVLGHTIAAMLFKDGKDPVGEFVLVNNIPFQVIGVMSARGASATGADQDDVVFLPIATGMVRLHGQRHLRAITVQVRDMSALESVQREITGLLTRRHQMEDFQISNMTLILKTVMQTADRLTLLLGAIAAISLIVGGIGVMNIMLVSVSERTREIGLRMATGARRLNIMLQFCTEALVMCVIGGLAGIVLGLGLAQGFAWFDQPVILSAWPIALAFGCAVAVGLFFGYLPARRAALLDPAIALGAF